MSDFEKIARDLALVTKWAFAAHRSKVPTEVWSAFNRLRSLEGGQPFASYLEEMDLNILYDIPKNWFVFLPSGTQSEFRVKNEDLRSRMTHGKSSFFSFALIAVMATFYPTRMALSSNQINEITLEKVYATIKRFASYVADMKGYTSVEAEDLFYTVVDEFTDMPETENGKTGKSGFQEYYVNAALKTLEDQGWVKAEKNGWLPREQMALVCNHRLNENSFAMANLLECFYDYYIERA
jgi:hypothetical protein